MLSLFAQIGYNQNYSIPINRSIESFFIQQLDTSSQFHSGIKPFFKEEVHKIINTDTFFNSFSISTNSSLLDQILNKNLIDIKKEKFSFEINPILNSGGGLEKLPSRKVGISEIAFGMGIKASFQKKWTGEFDFLADNSQYPLHIDYLLKQQFAGQGYSYTKNQQAMYFQGNISFKADEVFTFQVGVGKNFIGDGYRSLFLSDYSNSYPYFKATATIWKIKYTALYTNFQDIRYGSGSYSDFRHKFSTIHHLSFNATKWLNLSFFESIVFEAQEGSFYRGFDLSYLNPVIFLRPVEYHQGSADNALLGGGFKIKIKKNNILYSQLLLDEFLLSEIRANKGWWANKYGYQFGIKFYDFASIKRLKLQAEYNVVRPFTYSYFEEPSRMNTLQNYGHYNLPLAHPLGANFTEIVGIVSYYKNRWLIEFTNTFATVGLDTNTTSSIGQNIYLPYNLREKEYGYQTGGGLKTTIVNNSLKVSFLLNPKMKTILSLEINNRSYKNNHSSFSSNWITIGLKTALFNRYFDI